MVKFLIIRFSSIGDIVLTTPVIRIIHKQIDDIEIHYLTKNIYKNLIENNTYITKIHTLDNKNYKELIKSLKSENFDYIIDLHNNIRTLKIKNSLKALSFTLNKLNFKKWLLVNFKINKLPNKHIVDRYLDTLKPFDVHNDNLGLDFFLNNNTNINNFNIPNNTKNICIVVGAQHFTKQIPSNIITEICNNTNYNIILIGGENDENKAKEIEKNCTKPILNLVGKLSINESALVISKSDLIITSDTGLMHIASAFKKDIISIWGNTVPEFGMFPYMSGKNSQIIENKSLKCRPCSKIGYNSCPKKHFNCMNNIDTKKIITSIDKILK